MVSSGSVFHFKKLRRSNSSEEYKLYRAALEWDLIDPIIIEKRDDFKSIPRWRDKVEPFDHQVANLITFCRRLPVTLIADEVGLGKTISAGLIISELMSRGRISKILVVCPTILADQWKEELNTKFGIPALIAIGSKLSTAQIPEGVGAVITTYNSSQQRFETIKQAGFDMLILDEVHKLRNLYGTNVSPKVAQRFKAILENRPFKYVLMLTGTPIQNRLWDLYSLIDLLSVARGHKNPLGNEKDFKKNYIADNKISARKLNPEKRDKFREIVYTLISRYRHVDVNLPFPERIIKHHGAVPTEEESELIRIVSGSISTLKTLSKISILQALISSPQALVTQLNEMAEKGNISSSFAEKVQTVVNRIPITAKMKSLGVLVDELKSKQPERWRLILFTGRLETQKNIEKFLKERFISCGLINGNSGPRNQKTIAKFKKEPPEINVIISTDAGSEGINLQCANVLVNYDLPWNPMIVEQRIGRIHRLGSNHATVTIFNIVLQGTFEENIVGRLLEKLQMASHAIGDLEALLEESGINDGKDSFENIIQHLVLKSLEGKDYGEDIRKTEKSISDAKDKLESAQANFDTLVEGMDGPKYDGPQCPQMPTLNKSMDAQQFVLTALKNSGAVLVPQTSNLYISNFKGKQELIYFNNIDLSSGIKGTMYEPGSPSFERLVSNISSQGLHRVCDADKMILEQAEDISRKWVNKFGGIFSRLQVKNIWRCFSGSALIRVRATVAHDSYERLIEIQCSPNEHVNLIEKYGNKPIGDIIELCSSVGIMPDYLIERGKMDPGITEFCRFYTDRLIQELKSAGNISQRNQLEKDFIPRFEIELVGLEGSVHRKLEVLVSYTLDFDSKYKSSLIITPVKNEVNNSPKMGICAKTENIAPLECLNRCEISGLTVYKYLLVRSAINGRLALPEHTVVCSLTNKRVLNDEVEISAVTGRVIRRDRLQTSPLSGKFAEPEYFTQCEFSRAKVLESEIAVSQVSGKLYRIDEELRSAVSEKTGHQSEFIFCSETKKPLIPTEALACEISGKIVIPSLLETCEITKKRVLPLELEKSSVTGKRALKNYFVPSSISEAPLLEQEAIVSNAGKFCLPLETKLCRWSGRLYHPDDLRTCWLTGVSAHRDYMTMTGQRGLESLVKLLDGKRIKSDRTDLWNTIVASVSNIPSIKHCKVEVAELSPDRQHLAVCLKVHNFIVFTLHYVGFLYSIPENNVIGKIIRGKREAKGWILKNTISFHNENSAR